MCRSSGQPQEQVSHHLRFSRPQHSQHALQFKDLRAARHLLYLNSRYQAKLQKKDVRIADVEQACSDLKTQLEKEREVFEKLEAELRDEQATAAKLDEEQQAVTLKCEELEKQLDAERASASAKYSELERAAFQERDSFAQSEKALEEEKARLKAECDGWRT